MRYPLIGILRSDNEMDKIELATMHEFEFCDGTTCKLSLSFIRLKMLSSINPTLFGEVMEIMSRDCKDIFEALKVLYGAYVCANIEVEKRDQKIFFAKKRKLMSEEEFIERCGSDRIAVVEALQKVTDPKNRAASASHSSREHTDGSKI